MKVFLLGQRLRFSYTNHREETEVRTVQFEGLDYGDNEWYPDRQWFLRGFDESRNAHRSFALARIDGDEIEVVG
jgi:predicted DNA-binding transcriptional regulator YafY